MKRAASAKPIQDAVAAGSLEFQRSLIRGILDASPDGILVVDQQNLVVLANQRFFELWDIPREAPAVIGTQDQPILAMAVERVKHPETFLKRVRELYSHPTLDDHCEVELRDGRTLERHSTVLRSANEHYLGRVWFFRDITQRKRTEATLRDLATHDPLTGISNRRYFFDRAHKEFARARRYPSHFSLIAIDIDHFKDINDRYGHAAGDQVLKALCDCCREVLRDSDLFARMGGEEFAALLQSTDLNAAELTAERLRQSVVQHQVMVAKDAIAYTISAGVATLSARDTSVEHILQRADAALYRAKKNGRNRVEVETNHSTK